MAARVAAVFFVPLPLLLLVIHGCAAQQTVQFAYSGARGPEKWATLDHNFSMCSTGKSQSPISIVTDKCHRNQNLPPLVRRYHAANATLVNYGFTVGISYQGSAGTLTLNGKNYSFVQMHWHSPSEHRIDGVRYDAELHMVHKADDGNVSVVGILFHYGPPDPIIAKIQSELVELSDEVHKFHHVQAHIGLGTFDTKQVRKTTHKYYRYMGSFSTPPCTENVMWSVLGKVRSISREQVEALKAPLDNADKNNSRPVQELNGRDVQIYEE